MTQLGEDTTRSSQASLNYYPIGAGGGTVLETSLEGGIVTVDVADRLARAGWTPEEEDGRSRPCYQDDRSGVRLGHGVLTMLEVPGVTGVRVLIDGIAAPGRRRRTGAGSSRRAVHLRRSRADVVGGVEGRTDAGGGLHRRPEPRSRGRSIDHDVVPGGRGAGARRGHHPNPSPTARSASRSRRRSRRAPSTDEQLIVQQSTATGDDREVAIPLAHDAALPNC